MKVGTRDTTSRKDHRKVNQFGGIAPDGFQITQMDNHYRRSISVVDKFSAYSALMEISKSYGFGTFSLLVFPVEQSLKYAPTLYITNNSNEFLEKYDDGNHLPNNYTIFRLRQSTEPITWDIRTYQHDARKVERKRTIDLLAEYGMFMGANFGLNDNRGNQGAMIFSGDRDIPNVTELAELNLLSNVIFDRLDIQPESNSESITFHLSERERQVLEWASAGKTSWEIASIIELSEHTVNQYLASSILKLGATNRIHAVAKALRLKLID
ncbi:MAG: autoinducer binding domain-containing protein [Pararhodobacter sp.]|nr:autoinducer binding domain-containing protein [Pararhodobacter sp.]